VSQTLNVHVRVNDADTGKPTPVRIRIGGPNGEYFAPLGRPAEFPVGRGEDVGGHVYVNQKRYGYIHGGCEVPLPTGVPLSVEITKGPAYIPILETVTLGEGQLTLRFAIRRWTTGPWNDLYSADTRCHFLTPHSARLEAAAEGLDLVHLLATVHDYPSEDGHRYRIVPNLTAFSGQDEAIPGVVVNTLNVHPTLGRLALLHCHRPVYPLTFGHMDETDDWSLSDWCEQCHRKRGLVVWCDAYRPQAGLPGGEALVNAILGKIDAIEIDAQDRAAPFLPMWYRLLNAGMRVPVVGGSGKDSNRIALGGARTLSPATRDTSPYREWVEHVRAGRTVATNGPFVRLTVSGETFATRVMQDAPGPLRITAEAASIVPLERLEVIANGEVIAATSPTDGEVRTARLEVEHTLPDGGWVAARCWGPARSELYPHAPAFAHTSPTFVVVSGRPTPRMTAAVASLNRDVEAVRHWIDTEGRFTIPKRKEHLLSLCDAATGKLAGRP